MFQVREFLSGQAPHDVIYGSIRFKSHHQVEMTAKSFVGERFNSIAYRFACFVRSIIIKSFNDLASQVGSLSNSGNTSCYRLYFFHFIRLFNGSFGNDINKSQSCRHHY